MYIVSAVRYLQRSESMSQHFLVDYPPRDFGPIHVNIWTRRRFGCDEPRSLEIVIVMAPSAAQREGCGYSEPAPTRPPDTLLVIEPDRRHVRESDRLQRTDIDTNLHRHCHAQK